MNRSIRVIAAALYAFLHVPLLVLAVFSINSSRFTVWESVSWKWYAAAFQDAELAGSAWNSLLIAAAATALSTAVGTLCAYGLWKQKSRWINASLSLSLVTPEIVLGISLLAFYQFLFRVLRVELGMHTVILAHVSFCTAYVVVVVLSRLRTFEPALEEAAMDLGATPWQAFRLVTLPALIPGIIAAALLAFAISFDDYVITSMVAGVNSETLPMVIYALARRGANPVVNAISTILVVGLGLLVLAAEKVRAR